MPRKALSLLTTSLLCFSACLTAQESALVYVTDPDTLGNVYVIDPSTNTATSVITVAPGLPPFILLFAHLLALMNHLLMLQILSVQIFTASTPAQIRR